MTELTRDQLRECVRWIYARVMPDWSTPTKKLIQLWLKKLNLFQKRKIRLFLSTGGPDIKGRKLGQIYENCAKNCHTASQAKQGVAL